MTPKERESNIPMRTASHFQCRRQLEGERTCFSAPHPVEVPQSTQREEEPLAVGPSVLGPSVLVRRGVLKGPRARAQGPRASTQGQ